MSPQLAEQCILPCSHMHARLRRTLCIMGAHLGLTVNSRNMNSTYSGPFNSNGKVDIDDIVRHLAKTRRTLEWAAHEDIVEFTQAYIHEWIRRRTPSVTIFSISNTLSHTPSLFPSSTSTNTHTHSQDISHSHTCHITHHTHSHHGPPHHDIIHDSHSLSMTSSKIQTQPTSNSIINTCEAHLSGLIRPTSLTG
jgi:hypothetical protein